MQAKEEENSVQIAVLAAELKRTRWEKGIVEQQAETLKTALAVWTGRPSQVCFMILLSHSFTQFFTHSLTYSPTNLFIDAFVDSLTHMQSLIYSFIQHLSS